MKQGHVYFYIVTATLASIIGAAVLKRPRDLSHILQRLSVVAALSVVIASTCLVYLGGRTSSDVLDHMLRDQRLFSEPSAAMQSELAAISPGDRAIWESAKLTYKTIFFAQPWHPWVARTAEYTGIVFLLVLFGGLIQWLVGKKAGWALQVRALRLKSFINFGCFLSFMIPSINIFPTFLVLMLLVDSIVSFVLSFYLARV